MIIQRRGKQYRVIFPVRSNLVHIPKAVTGVPFRRQNPLPQVPPQL